MRANLLHGLMICAAICVAVLAGCPDREKLKGTGCSVDSDCGSPEAGFRCEAETGVCFCRTNEGCPPQDFCNTAGFCQDKSGCEKNDDCLGADLFCDTGTGTCLSEGRCTIDLHCTQGQVCDSKKSICVDGCRRDGDCPGISCRCGDLPCACTGTTQEEIQACQIGECDLAFCSNDTFCNYGQSCGVPPDAGTVRNECYSDYDPNRRPYCDNCSFGGGVEVCGKGPNYCLVDTAHPGNSYCGADCSEGQICPRGYACQDVIVVGLPGTQQCSAANPSCNPNPTKPCAEDTDCKLGGFCAKATGATMGYCTGRCAVDEGDSVGFCTCLSDSDCGQESCSGGECSISRKACIDASDCNSIRCVDFNGYGGCLIGQNCAPSNGLSCLNVQPR